MYGVSLVELQAYKNPSEKQWTIKIPNADFKIKLLLFGKSHYTIIMIESPFIASILLRVTTQWNTHYNHNLISIVENNQKIN